MAYSSVYEADIYTVGIRDPALKCTVLDPCSVKQMTFCCDMVHAAVHKGVSIDSHM